MEQRFEKIVKDFWDIDCLIRMMKEIIFKDSWEMREDDVDTVCEILAEKSEKLRNEVEELKTQI